MNPVVLRECTKHGLTEFRISKDSPRGRCKKCGVEAVGKRRKVIKLKAIEYKGGVCAHCGKEYPPEVFDFHHLDPSQKDFGISHGHCRSWDKNKAELDKCVMLCANCHRMVHARLGLK